MALPSSFSAITQAIDGIEVMSIGLPDYLNLHALRAKQFRILCLKPMVFIRFIPAYGQDKGCVNGW